MQFYSFLNKSGMLALCGLFVLGVRREAGI